MWFAAALRRRLAAAGDPAGRPLRELFAGLRVAHLTATVEPAPWYDCDTEEQLRAAEGWA